MQNLLGHGGLDPVAQATGWATAQQLVLADRGGPLQVVMGELYVAPVLTFITPGVEAAVEASHRITVPPGTRLERATFGIGASAPGSTRLGSVADVRSVDASSAVVDFGRLVTVGSLSTSGLRRTITAVDRWTGAEWVALTDDPESMAEQQCDRLLVHTSGTGSVEQVLAEDGRVDLPACPTTLELAIDGQVVWFDRQGSTPDLVAVATNGARVATVFAESGGPLPTLQHAADRSAAVADALTRAFADPAADPAMSRTLDVTLRSATPGLLQLAVQTTLLHEWHVDFGTPGAPSPTRAVTAAAEGVTSLGLPTALGATDQVREVTWSLTGSVGPERVSPVTDVAVSDLAELVLAPGRTTLLGLPRDHAQRFSALTGVRLQVRADQPSEITGRLLDVDDRGRPGEPFPDGVLTATAVPPSSPDAPPGWLTLSWPRPVTLPSPEPGGAGAPPSPPLRARVAAWLELSPTFGRPVCSLTAPDDVTVSAPVHRRLPGGGTRALLEVETPTRTAPPAPAPDQSAHDPAVPAVPVPLATEVGETELTPLEAVVRLVGLPPETSPIPAVELSVLPPATAPAATVSAVVLADPARDPVEARVLLADGWAPEPDGTVHLQLTFHAAADLTLDAVTVAYEEMP